MKFEPVDPSIVNKLYKRTKLQTILDRFMSSKEPAVHCILNPGDYSSLNSAQSTYCKAIKRLGYPIAVRVIAGEMYLVKIATERRVTDDE